MNWRSLLDRAPEDTFALAALVAPPLAVLVPYGMAVELPILGVISALVLWHRGQLGLVPRLPLMFLAVFCLWGGLSLFWAPDPIHGAVTLLRVAALSILGCCALGMARLARQADSQMLIRGLALGLAVAVLLLALDYSRDHALSAVLAQLRGGKPLPEGYKSLLSRGAAMTALLLWPVLQTAWARRSVVSAVVALAAMGIVMLGDNLAAVVAGAAGLLVLTVVLLLPRSGPRWIGVVAAALVAIFALGAPHLPQPPDSFATLPRLPSSAQHRLVIWNYTGQRIAEHPLRGWGMDAARLDPGGDEEVNILERLPSGRIVHSVTGARLPLHPHNAILQWWMELGLPGAVLLAILLWGIARSIGGSRQARAVTTACFVTGLVISCISFGAWQSWWLASLWVAAAIGQAMTRQEVEP